MFPTSVLAIGSALCVVVLFAAFRAILGGGDGSSAIFASATRLDLSNQGLVQLPPDIFEKTELSHLDISHNKLTSLPSEIGHLATLTNLNCAGNQLASLPSQIGTLTALQLFGLKVNTTSNTSPNV
jgi:Leucine-rich repeat (LRR) protein